MDIDINIQNSHQKTCQWLHDFNQASNETNNIKDSINNLVTWA